MKKLRVSIASLLIALMLIGGLCEVAFAVGGLHVPRASNRKKVDPGPVPIPPQSTFGLGPH